MNVMAALGSPFLLRYLNYLSYLILSDLELTSHERAYISYCGVLEFFSVCNIFMQQKLTEGVIIQ